MPHLELRLGRRHRQAVLEPQGVRHAAEKHLQRGGQLLQIAVVVAVIAVAVLVLLVVRMHHRGVGAAVHVVQDVLVDGVDGARERHGGDVHERRGRGGGGGLGLLIDRGGGGGGDLVDGGHRLGDVIPRHLEPVEGLGEDEDLVVVAVALVDGVLAVGRGLVQDVQREDVELRVLRVLCGMAWGQGGAEKQMSERRTHRLRRRRHVAGARGEAWGREGRVGRTPQA